MAVTRSARLELRVTPAQKAAILRNAALSGKTPTEYAVDRLLRETVVCEPASLGWMAGTGVILGDLLEAAEPDGWESREP